MVQLSECPKPERLNEPNVWEPNTSLFIRRSDFGIPLYSLFLTHKPELGR